jgi:hypothetical protein
LKLRVSIVVLGPAIGKKAEEEKVEGQVLGYIGMLVVIDVLGGQWERHGRVCECAKEGK